MFRKLAFAALLVVGTATTASAQLFSAASTASLNAKKAESLALAVDLSGLSGQTVAGALSIAEGSTTSFGSITLTPTWDLANNRQVDVVAWISTSFSDGAGNSLPNSYLEGAVGAGAYAPFTGSSASFGATNNALLLQTTTATGADRKVTGTAKQFTLNLQMVVPAAATVVPGTYSAVLTMQAVAQ